MKPTPVGLCLIHAILSLGGASTSSGAASWWELTARSQDLDGLYQVSRQYYPVLDRQTNPAVVARIVAPFLPPGYGQPVFFSSQTSEVLLASSLTNHNCFLSGRLFRVDAAAQALYVTPSTPLGASLFTAQSALEIGKRAFISAYAVHDSPYGSAFESDTNAFVQHAVAGRGAGGLGVLVDLRPLVTQHLGAIDAKYFQLSRTGVAIRPQGASLQVSFECYGPYRADGKMIKGTVVLDLNLNVLSMAITDPGK